MKYEINNPDKELNEGYFTLILKYLTLFIIGWFGGWLFLLFYPNPDIPADRREWFTNLLFDNPGITSLAVALALVYYFIQRAYRKYVLGLITVFEFDDDNSILSLGLLNTITGAQRSISIEYANLKTTLTIKENQLFGKQRIFEIFDKYKLINRINIELTAWCRHPEITEIVSRLNDFSNNKRPTKKNQEQPH